MAGLRDPEDGAQSVWPGVLQGLAVVSKWQQPRVIKPAGTVTVNFQAAAGSWFSTGGLRTICWQLLDDQEVNLELWVMDRGKAGDGQARGRQMVDDRRLTVSNRLSKKA